ncbi:type I-E CRISPR-associated protein Cas7/Cse4/CasC [Natronoglycomyces albus]|uniref:Type I-E CRISPR-associated protein Cas7/Cse4/CasC n=1 Tax=Natronoglycomyces albus TaxID=2811108 RepID=A0A895XN24_9ACTN|nr:type I-E CRISPR-associated protein Cas7/Cse4/CasC [Natronoglycomyces albus]QSB06527.1 type I-E CRISPR-associated protein Cas7/Cse4/CasC [Natronoglycomyces albus]
MNQPRFIDFHALQTLPFSNPNRDEEGAPKTVVFGGVERSRISSQSWKRRIRLDVEAKLGDPAVRTRRVVRGVADRLHNVHDWPMNEAEAAGKQVARSAGNGIKLEKSKDEKNEEILTTSVLLFLPEAGLDELTEIAAQHRDDIIAEEAKKKPKGILPAEAIAEVLGSRNGTINLFGRMLAELPGANVDGAVQMAHAFTVHETNPEFDFFAAVDDIEQQAGIPGSGHINTAMFTAGTFYRYANIDLDGLLDNLGGDRAAAAELVTAFAQAFIRTVPTGKDRPTAPMTIPDLVHLAVRSDRPASMAAAFERPVRAVDQGHLATAAATLDRYIGRVNRLLGADHLQWSANTHLLDDAPNQLGESRDSFDDLIDEAVRNALPQE